MLAKRIIPCLDIMNGRVVKGVNFNHIRNVGDPIELAKYYSDQGADELVFLDISATIEGRKLIPDVVSSIAESINIPFSVGGGIGNINDISTILNEGADKVCINSAGFLNPTLIKEASETYGRQCIICAIDAGIVNGEWTVFLAGGKKNTNTRLFDWAKEAAMLGAGEILFTSIENDGTKQGFALEPLSELSATLSVPIIASGGAGEMEHFKDAFTIGKADAALAASIFHYGDITINKLKNYLRKNNIEMRI